MHDFLAQTREKIQKLQEWRAANFRNAATSLESIFCKIRKSGHPGWKDNVEATRQILRIVLFHTEFYLLVFGMGVLVYVTKSFTAAGVEYGVWRPLVVSLATIFAGSIPLFMIVLLFPFHIFFNVSTWLLTCINVILSANIFALVEPAIPETFYHDGILYYDDLIYPILVFYALALGYLHFRLNKYYSKLCVERRLASNRLPDILPPNIRGQVISLKAQDHYVEVATEKGMHLVRISLKEAIEMLPPHLGIKVHRSHWVAVDAIVSMEKSGERYFVVLSGGRKVPMAKAHSETVKMRLNERAPASVSI